MDFVQNSFSFASATGVADIVGKSYEPENPIGVVQITHGMAEHIERYNEFAAFLASNGYAVFLHDDAGHGKSKTGDDMLGFFGEENGYLALVDDVKSVTDLAKAKYPTLPYILFGHSMGSFVARSYCAKYPEFIDGAVICGTSGKNPGAGMGAKIAGIIAKRKGSMYRSEFINNLAFGSYCKKISNPRTPFDWLTRDGKIVDDYIADPYCGFLFTAKGYRDMFNLLSSVSTVDWYAKIPLRLSMFFIAGGCDPVGSYGKGVDEVVNKLKSTGHDRIDEKLYPEDRHEILNELDRVKVYNDILEWIGKIKHDI